MQVGLTAACWTFISTGRRKSHRERASLCVCVCVAGQRHSKAACPTTWAAWFKNVLRVVVVVMCMYVWNSILLIPPTASVHTHGGFAGGGECFGFILYSTTHLRMPTPFHGTCVRVMRGRLIVLILPLPLHIWASVCVCVLPAKGIRRLPAPLHGLRGSKMS